MAICQENLNYQKVTKNFTTVKIVSLDDFYKQLNLEKSEIKQLKRNKRKVANALKDGDTQIAKVISLDPLLISCYSDEFDSILIYKYPTKLVEMYNLKENQLLTNQSRCNRI